MKLRQLILTLILTLIFSLTILSPAKAVEVTLPLSEVYPAKAVDLKCIDSKYDISLPIPERWKINSARFKFNYINSASLLRKNSQLVVRLNGTPLAQMKLDPNAPEGKAEVELPKLLLQPGYNKLSFAVSQHYAEQCELPCVPELWTRLNLDQAEITFDYDQVDVPLQVSSVANFLFDEKNVRKPRVHLITENSQAEMMTLGAVVASGVALRYNYRPVQFSTSDALNPGVDNILIGTSDFVNRFLSKFNLSIPVEKPLIQVLAYPYLVTENDLTTQKDQAGENEQISEKDQSSKKEKTIVKTDPKHALIVISGHDAKQLRLAVESFDILSIPFPNSDHMQIHQFELPKIALYSGKHMVTPGEEYPFHKLDFNTITYRGFSAGLETIDFRVPPDFLIKPNQYVTVSLNFAYGAGFRIDSVLNIVLNGQYVSSIHLDNPRGALVSNYKLSLPTYLFEGGMNTLSFSPVLTPLVTENCSFIHAENLFLTLFDSSTFTFPEMPHQIDMPRLDLLFVNGFPFTRWPDGYKTLLYLADTDDQHLNAAYNMIGVLSQKNGYPLLGVQLSDQLPNNFDGELMMIGTLDKLPKRYRDLAPLKFGALNKVPYPVFKGVEQQKSLAFSTQKSQLGVSKGGLMQFESPDTPGRSVVMLIAQDSDAIERLSLALQETSVQSAIKNDLTLIDFIEQTESSEDVQQKPWRYVTTTVHVGKSYVTGKGGEISPVKALLASNKYIYWGLIGGSILVLVWLLTGVINRQKNQRNPEGHDDT